MTGADLRAISLLGELSDARLDELAASGEELRLTAGEHYFREGDPATHFAFVLEGELETTKQVGGDEVALQRHGPGGYLGAVALLTETPFRASTRAVTDSRLFLVGPDVFHRLVLGEPSVRRTVFRVFAPVMQGLQDAVRDREKLIALGRLSAGLAHEINNPASAARRAIGELRELEAVRDRALTELLDGEAAPAGVARVCALVGEAARAREPAERPDPLDRADREAELADILEARGIRNASRLAGPLADVGLGTDWVDRVADAAGEDRLEPALAWAVGTLAAPQLLAELEEATRRVSELVGAVKQYSYMDQAPRQEVDVHEGLESTLTMLSHKLRQGSIEIVREYDPELPRVDAFGSELNQVWTNLIDNAVDVLAGSGRIVLRTACEPGRVVVEVRDDGPGIPDDVRSRIFDPFFTTKDVGTGTGLGLDIANRVVHKHHGELRVESRPGDTRFTVVLPLRAPEGR